LALINVVVQCQIRLVPGLVTVCPPAGKLFQYVTSQLGQLSLLPSVGQ